MMLPEAARPPRQSLRDEESTTAWVAVMAWMGGMTVGGARRARHVVGLALVVLGVDTHDNGEGVVLGGGGEDHLLHASVSVGLGLLLGEEHPGGLAKVLHAGLGP